MKIDEIGALVKSRRAMLNIDQKTLSELSGVGVHTLSDIESGKGNPTIQVLGKIVSVLGMEVTVGVNNET